jgi:hypothetical protein
MDGNKSTAILHETLKAIALDGVEIVVAFFFRNSAARVAAATNGDFVAGVAHGGGDDRGGFAKRMQPP